MSDWSSWPAPAKVNLFLHITGRREDGYHDLQTAFQLLDFGDTVHLRLRDDGRIERHKELPGVAYEADLTVRAAKALQIEGGTGMGADLWVEKRLPAGGGLGGGSSDAATVLLGLNWLWGLGLDRDRVARLGLSLGADVPVFVRGYSAWAEGVGELLQPLPEDVAEGCWYLVIDPRVEVSTARVFGDPRLTRDSIPVTIEDLRAGRTVNDCEAVVRRDWPDIDSALQWLGRYGKAQMSGTGACCFVVLGSEAAAQSALGSLPAKWRGFVSKGTSRSVLEGVLAKVAAKQVTYR